MKVVLWVVTLLEIAALLFFGWWAANSWAGSSETKARCECPQERKDMHEYEGKIVHVVDGDTIDATIDLGFKIQTAQRLRLARVDTPEKGQPNFEKAKAFVTEMAEGKLALIRTHKVSKWGYYLADVTIDGKDVSDALIGAGLGKPYDGGKK